jgi:hypothetical protein
MPSRVTPYNTESGISLRIRIASWVHLVWSYKVFTTVRRVGDINVIVELEQNFQLLIIIELSIMGEERTPEKSVAEKGAAENIINMYESFMAKAALATNAFE